MLHVKHLWAVSTWGRWQLLCVSCVGVSKMYEFPLILGSQSHTGFNSNGTAGFEDRCFCCLVWGMRCHIPSGHTHITHSWTWLFTDGRDRLISAMGCRDTVAHMNGQKENFLHKGKVRMQSPCQSTWLTALFRLLKKLKVKLTRGKTCSQISTQTEQVLWEGRGTYESQRSVQREAISSVANTRSKHLAGWSQLTKM